MKNTPKTLLIAFLLGLATLLATPNTGQAQCPMCKIAAESNYKHGGETGKGLNRGILYMLATPYLLVGGLGYIWWRNRRRADEEDEDFE